MKSMKRGTAAKNGNKNGEEEKQGELGYRLSFCEQREKMGHTTPFGGGPVSSEHRTVATNHLQVTVLPLHWGESGSVRTSTALHRRYWRLMEYDLTACVCECVCPPPAIGVKVSLCQC